MTGACASNLLLPQHRLPAICLPALGSERQAAAGSTAVLHAGAASEVKTARPAGPTSKVPLRSRLHAALQSHTHLHAFLPGALQAPPARCCCCLRTPTP